jgi:hypothetical protein
MIIVNTKLKLNSCSDESMTPMVCTIRCVYVQDILFAGILLSRGCSTFIVFIVYRLNVFQCELRIHIVYYDT